jgi:hypothetical protein
MTSRPDLRPRSIGENLDAGFKLFTSNFKQLVTVAAVILIPVAIVNAVISTAAGSFNYFDLISDPENLDLADDFGAFIALTILTGIIGALGSLVVQAAAVGVIGDSYQGRQTTWREGLSIGLRKAFPVLLTGILIGLIAIGLVIVIVIAVLILAQISQILAGITAFFVFIGLLISIFTMAYVAVPSLIVEDLGPVQAIGRSFSMVRHRFWPTFWTGFLAAIIVGIISTIVSSIIQLSVAGPAIFSASETGELSGGLVFASSAVSSALVSIFQTPFLAAVGLAVYFDLRVRQEGFDLELLARELDESTGAEAPPETGTDPFGLDSPE